MQDIIQPRPYPGMDMSQNRSSTSPMGEDHGIQVTSPTGEDRADLANSPTGEDHHGQRARTTTSRSPRPRERTVRPGRPALG